MQTTAGPFAYVDFALRVPAARDRPAEDRRLRWVDAEVISRLVVRMLRKPVDPARQTGMIEKMRSVASSPWIAVFARELTHRL
jgi:hypothetical protein